MKTLALLLCLATQAPAQTLRLSDAIKLAEQRYPQLAFAKANVDETQSSVREARSAQLPSLSVDGNLTQFDKPMVVAPLHGFDPRNPPVFDRTLTQGSLA